MNEYGITWMNPYGCEEFSKLKGLDLQELIIKIENLYLVYRESLGIDESITFGYEIEYENLKRVFVDNYLNKEKLIDWIWEYDGSVPTGGEIRTPIMNDQKLYWQNLQKVCKFLQKKKANTCGNAGGHIHIGAQIIGRDAASWKNFLLIYANYEHILSRFFCGDKISLRIGFERYAAPIRKQVIKMFNGNYSANYNIYELLKNDYLRGKYNAVNFENIKINAIDRLENKNTIEFRYPNATASEVIWQNNTNAIIKLLLASQNKDLDIEKIGYELDKKENQRISIYYNEICLKDALDFVDLVFTTNIDKVYFLHQYFKNFENNYGINGAVLAKRFIK